MSADVLGKAPPAPECAADELVLLLLGEQARRHWATLTSDRYNWRGAHIASWSVPVACCIKCRGEQVGCDGLSARGTTHRQCFPEAWS